MIRSYTHDVCLPDVAPNRVLHVLSHKILFGNVSVEDWFAYEAQTLGRRMLLVA